MNTLCLFAKRSKPYFCHSYIQNIYAPDPDPNLTIEEYERTWHESEELGLNDIKTDEY